MSAEMKTHRHPDIYMPGCDVPCWSWADIGPELIDEVEFVDVEQAPVRHF